MKSFHFFLFFLLSNVNVFSQENKISTLDEQRIDSICYAFINQNGIPGMSVGIIRKNQTLYKKGYGLRTIGTTDSIKTATTFHMASISKPFVSIAIIQLVEKQKIFLDDPVTEYLTYFKMADERFASITVRQLLLHTSGIPDIGPSENYHWDQPEFDEEALERLVRSLQTWPLEFKPGKKCSYSNTGYNVLGDIIAKVSRQSFEDYMAESILKPLGMNNSSFFLPAIDTMMIATPHIGKEGKTIKSNIYPYNRAHGPSGTLNANMDNMCRFTQCILNRGKLEDVQLYNVASHEQLTTPAVKRNKIMQFSLGWEIGPFRKTIRMDYSGRDVGFNTYLMMVPSEGFAIILLMNHFDSPPAFGVINTAYDIALKY